MAKKKIRYQLFILMITIPALSAFLAFQPSTPQASTSSFTSSSTCKKCHEEIYSHWKNAMHSLSYEDPIFAASYMEAYFNTAGEAKYQCLPCHAPITLVNKDFDLKQEITKEGVTCDFCHSIKNVNLDKKGNPFEFDIGNIKRGPLAKNASPAHETEMSPLFKSSKLCAGCHEYVNDKGISVLGTYSEWKESPQAKEGTQCQSCHMPEVDGNIVKPKIKSSSQKKINLHAISASHSAEQLQKALSVKIENIYEENGALEVTIAVTNVGSAHRVPTGIPSRKLILTVELKSERERFQQQRVYQRILLDDLGNQVKKECEAFIKASRVSLDNRLNPREKRIERFAFMIPKLKNISITARVDYLYKTNILQPTEMRVMMAEDTKSFSP